MTPSRDAPSNTASVIAGVIQRLSVSQLKRHKLCPRAWFFQKVMRLPEPTTGAQQVGTEGHAQLEHFLSTGEDVLGAFAKAGAHLLPTRSCPYKCVVGEQGRAGKREAPR